MGFYVISSLTLGNKVLGGLHNDSGANTINDSSIFNPDSAEGWTNNNSLRLL